jgi:hypothetical protein
MFNENQSFILQCHQYLFTDRTLDQHLFHSYDHISCWIRSVEEAILVVAHHDQVVLGALVIICVMSVEEGVVMVSMEVDCVSIESEELAAELMSLLS